MPTFMIERNLPGASKLTPEELQGVARTSNAVADDVYEHARRAGFPLDLCLVCVATRHGPAPAAEARNADDRPGRSIAGASAERHHGR